MRLKKNSAYLLTRKQGQRSKGQGHRSDFCGAYFKKTRSKVKRSRSKVGFVVGRDYYWLWGAGGVSTMGHLHYPLKLLICPPGGVLAGETDGDAST